MHTLDICQCMQCVHVIVRSLDLFQFVYISFSLFDYAFCVLSFSLILLDIFTSTSVCAIGAHKVIATTACTLPLRTDPPEIFPPKSILLTMKNSV